jgi:hypothetical protein
MPTTWLYSSIDESITTAEQWAQANQANDDDAPGWTTHHLAAIDRDGYAFFDAGNGGVEIVVKVKHRREPITASTMPATARTTGSSSRIIRHRRTRT